MYLSKKERNEVADVMRKHVGESRETYVGDTTSLAEDAAHDLDHDEWLDDPHHDVWEIAVLVAGEEGLLE